MSTGQSTGSVHTCAAELHVSDGVEGGLESTLEGSLLGLPLGRFLPLCLYAEPRPRQSTVLSEECCAAMGRGEVMV